MIHYFDVEIAKVYGVNAAILLQNLGHWIEKNKANEINYYDGNYWTYNSRRAYRELFPYMSERQIDTAFKKLIDDGVVITGNYNELKYDRTLWYALTEKGKSILHFDGMERNEMSNQFPQNVKPIPNINTDNKPNINTDKENTMYSMSTSVDALKVKPSEIVAIYHEICKSYPKVRAISESRKKAINARLRNHSVEEVKEVFERAEHSAFLKGNNQRNWSADFDWLMKDTNFCKVLDGKYDNKNGQQNNGYSQPNYSQPAQPKKEETEEEIQKRQHEQYLKLCEAFGWNPDEDFEEVEEKSPEERLREIYEEQERVREGRKREWI